MCNELLSEWIQERGRGALTALSKSSGLSPGHLHDIKSGKTEITKPTALKLQLGTGIKAAVWLGLEQPKRRAKT